MKKSTVFLLNLACLILVSCNNSKTEKSGSPVSHIDTVSKFLQKPFSTFQDTLVINYKAAVFYHPDSVQLLKIKQQTDSMVFDGNMHEFFYQMRNARMVIKRTWPDLKIVEARDYRYLLFIAKDGARACIDLDTKNDAYGLFVFNTVKPPLFIDMTNIETEVSFYLK